MDPLTAHRAAALLAGAVAGGVVASVLAEPLAVAATAVLWALGVAGVLRGYRTFPEWATGADVSRRGFVAIVAAVAAAKGAVVFLFAFYLVPASLGSVVWMSVSLAAVAPIAAGIGVVVATEATSDGPGEATG